MTRSSIPPNEPVEIFLLQQALLAGPGAPIPLRGFPLPAQALTPRSPERVLDHGAQGLALLASDALGILSQIRRKGDGFPDGTRL